MDSVKITEHFEKLLKVFKSCKNESHFLVAKNMAFNFSASYKKFLDTDSKTYIIKQIESEMNRCLFEVKKNESKY